MNNLPNTYTLNINSYFVAYTKIIFLKHLQINLKRQRVITIKLLKLIQKDLLKFTKNRAYLREKQNKNSDAKEDLKSYLKYFPRAPDRGVIEQAIREL